MIRKAKDLRRSQHSNLRDGDGTLEMLHFFEQEEARGAGRLFSIAIIPPGASIGKHVHEDNFEIYHLLKGTAHVTDNDVPGVMETGDTMLCLQGDSHSIQNRGEEDVHCLCIVLYGRD